MIECQMRKLCKSIQKMKTIFIPEKFKKHKNESIF